MRLYLTTLLGFLFGLFCAYMATIREPVPITFWVLVGAIYTRTLAGFFIGLLGHLKLLKNKMLNALLRGAFIGFIVSLPLALPYGPMGAMGFGLFGAIYGAIIDVLVTKIEEKNSKKQ